MGFPYKPHRTVGGLRNETVTFLTARPRPPGVLNQPRCAEFTRRLGKRRRDPVRTHPVCFICHRLSIADPCPQAGSCASFSSVSPGPPVSSLPPMGGEGRGLTHLGAPRALCSFLCLLPSECLNTCYPRGWGTGLMEPTLLRALLCRGSRLLRGALRDRGAAGSQEPPQQAHRRWQRGCPPGCSQPTLCSGAPSTGLATAHPPPTPYPDPSLYLPGFPASIYFHNPGNQDPDGEGPGS